MGQARSSRFHLILLSMYLFFKTLYRNIFIRDGFKGEDIQKPSVHTNNNGTCENKKISKSESVKEIKINALKNKVSHVLKICCEMEKKIVNYSETLENQSNKIRTTAMDAIEDSEKDMLQNMEKEFYEKLERLEYICQKKIEPMNATEFEIIEEYDETNEQDVMREEIRSLRVVLDLRNEEIRKLHDHLLCYREIQDKMDMKKEQVKRLVARVEDLEAQLNKSRQDKTELKMQLFDLASDISRLQSENTQLAKRNEQLSWKVHKNNSTQSPDIG